MKISLHIPKEANMDDIRSFVKKEISEARNIKRKETRKSVYAGLNKILRILFGTRKVGISIFTDGDSIHVESYDGI